MKGPGVNPFAGQNLNNQTAGAFTGALGVANNQLGMGQEALEAGAGGMTDAAGMFRTAGGFMPSDVTAGRLADTDLRPYMNPFQQGVIDPTMTELQRQEDMNRQNIGSQFQKAGAFGGDRQAIEQAENRRNFNTQRASTLGALNLANFNNAQQMATGDIERRFKGDITNQGMRQGMFGMGAQGLAGLGKDVMSAGMDWYDPTKLSQLAGQGFDFADKINSNNIQAGTLQQQQMQALIDAAKAQWEQFTNKPIQGLGAISGGYQPLGNKSESSPGALGILGNVVKGVGAICDPRLKEDVMELGVEPESGLRVYAFRYKGDPKSYAKVVGYMADEVEAAYPGTTIEVGGYRAVLTDKLALAIKEKAHAKAA